jgi:hypothetical protein
MIVFDLRCQPRGEVFEGWFASSSDYAEQIERGLVQCPYCGSAEVEKAPMAPRVRRANAPDASKALAELAELAELQGKLLSNSEWVGEELPDTARAMHLGEVERRPVHGHASAEQAQSLIEEGIPVLPLPLPVVPPGQVN